MNKPSTCIDSGTKLAQPRSGPVRQPVRFRLIDKDGNRAGMFFLAAEAIKDAEDRWPGQIRDEDREGRGWDIEPTR